MITKESKAKYISDIERDIDFIISQCEPCKERDHAVQSLREVVKLLYDPDIKRDIEKLKIEEPVRYSDTEYRIKHIPTGLYYQAKQQKTNLSTVGKIYNNTRGWSMFKSSSYVEINNMSKLYDDIVYKRKYPQLKYAKEHNSWDGDYLAVQIDLSEWEQEYIKL